ncbi:MAG: NPCBM/NEW2 domain-containing protein, partial [Limisphaerales bacterium]
SAKVGWGKPTRDHYYTGNGVRDGVCIELNGEFHPKAIYAHAPSRYVFRLDQRWKRFTTTVGLKDGAGPGGTGVFIVRGDGRELHRTKLLGSGQTAKIDLDVSDLEELQLITESGKQGNGGCWTVWGSPFISR